MYQLKESLYFIEKVLNQIALKDTLILFYSWDTKDIKSQGRLSIDSTGHKNLKISFGLGGSHFDSKGGVVGGNIDLQDINTHCKYS